MFSSIVEPCVYILTNKRNGTLYIGVTHNLRQRMEAHKAKQVEAFTKRYEVNRLVWYEKHDTMESAIRREKTLKKWKRAWKLCLIEEANPTWKELL